MTYYDTLAEDLVRTKQILADGKITIGEIGSLNDLPREIRDQIIADSGTISPYDTHAAYKLLESFVSEIERLQAECNQLQTLTAEQQLAFLQDNLECQIPVALYMKALVAVAQSYRKL